MRYSVCGLRPANRFSMATYPASSSFSICAPRLPSVEPVFCRNHVKSAASTPISSDSTARRSFPWTTRSSSGSSGMMLHLALQRGRRAPPFQHHGVQAEQNHAEERGRKEDRKNLVPGVEKEQGGAASPPNECNQPLHAPAQNSRADSVRESDEEEDRGIVRRLVAVTARARSDHIKNDGDAHCLPDRLNAARTLVLAAADRALPAPDNADKDANGNADWPCPIFEG